MAKQLKRGKWCEERSRPGNWWCNFKLPGGSRVRHALPTARDKREAEALASGERRKLQLVAEGTLRPDDIRATCTIEEAVARFYDEMSGKWSSHETADGYGRRLVESVGARQLNALTRQDIVNHVLKRQRGYSFDGAKIKPVSDGTIANEVDYLKVVLKRARNDWTLAVSDVDLGALGLVTKRKRHIGMLSMEKEKEIFKYVRLTRPDYYPAILYAFSLGKRRGNVIGLKWSDIDWDQDFHGRITQLGKSPRGEQKMLVTPLTAEAAELIRAQQGLHPVYVFTWVCKRSRADQGLIAGRRYPFKEETLRRFWLDLRADLKLPAGYRFHDIRHQTATLVRNATGDITKSQKMLGHSDLATTALYLEDEVAHHYAALVALQTVRDDANAPGPKPRGGSAAEQIAALEQKLAELRAQQVVGSNVVPLKRAKA